MPVARVERRLAAILAADIVGYSRLIEQDEAATLEAVKALRSEVIEPRLAEHRGRIVKLMGDGAIAEFGSVVDAVACAVAIQGDAIARQAEIALELCDPGGVLVSGTAYDHLQGRLGLPLELL
jgi:class 3 adenylate cyclase